MSTSPLNPKVGRCQHCQQIRPVWHYNATFDNGEHIWSTPYPKHWPWTGAWLCARDWSAAETCRINGTTFHVEHDLEVWFWREDRPVRVWAAGREVLGQAEEDLKTCQAILAATDTAATTEGEQRRACE